MEPRLDLGQMHWALEMRQPALLDSATLMLHLGPLEMGWSLVSLDPLSQTQSPHQKPVEIVSTQHPRACAHQATLAMAVCMIKWGQAYTP